MTGHTELKRLAEAANAVTGGVSVDIAISSERGPNQPEIDAVTAFVGAATPAAVLALIAENESLKGPHDWLAEDLIKELVDNAQAIQENADDGEDDPFVIVLLASASRIRRQEANIDKLRAENERLARTADCWDRLNILNKALSDSFQAERDQLKAESDRLTSLLKSWRDQAEENNVSADQLRAEIAGLKTGYEACERVNAELKAEVEGLRKDADRAAYWKQRAKSAEGHLFSGDFRAAAMELHKYSRFESTPWPELTGSQHALISSAAGAVIATVNRLRDARRPKNRDETDAIIWCACGDGHAANSYGAGFMDANNGVCANCDAALGQGEQS